MGHSRLWWTAILVPVAIIGGIELLADWVLDPYLPFPLDTLVVTVTTLVVALGLAGVAQRRIDLLARALDARTRELERRAGTARQIHQLGVAVAASHDLDSVLGAVTDATRRLLAADAALVLLEAGETGRVAAKSGPADAFVTTGLGLVEPRDALAEPYRRSVVAVPLHRGETTIGALVVGGRRERSFRVEELETLSSLASLLTLAIENARLEAQLREVAVRGERERIAREMHDGLAQVLGYVNTKSQAVEELLRQRRTPEAREQLAQLAAAARSIYVDVREAILGLTSPVSPERGLVGALEEYAGRFAGSAGIAVAVHAEPEAAAISMTPETEAQVFRIVQEALTNVRKHAAARTVEISIAVQDAGLEVRVADDGRGIDASRAADEGANGASTSDWPRYGLAAMRERAATIGAELELAGQVEHGTVVILRLPIAPPLASTATGTRSL